VLERAFRVAGSGTAARETTNSWALAIAIEWYITSKALKSHWQCMGTLGCFLFRTAPFNPQKARPTACLFSHVTGQRSTSVFLFLGPTSFDARNSKTQSYYGVFLPRQATPSSELFEAITTQQPPHQPQDCCTRNASVPPMGSHSSLKPSIS